MDMFINKQAKVSDFITSMKYWGLTNLNNILPHHIIEKTKSIHISLPGIDDQLTWKFTFLVNSLSK